MLRTLAQAVRLMPEVVSLPASMGLAINVSKSCALAVPLPAPLPGCLARFPVVALPTYLGLPLQLVEDDDCMLDRLCDRATAAFFSNRLLLIHKCASRWHKLRLFNSLVTASLRWSLCVLSVLSVKQSTFHRLCVHCVTLLTCLLGARAHRSWFQVECIQALRHGVKILGRTYCELWDCLLARMVWQWIGHVLRMPTSSLTRSVLLTLRSTWKSKRRRTGPDNSGHRPVLRYLHHQGISVDEAADRLQWQGREDEWVRRNGLSVQDSAANVYVSSSSQYLWTRRCLQGCYHGQQLIVAEVAHSLHRSCFELDRVLGWRRQSYLGDTLNALLDAIVATG